MRYIVSMPAKATPSRQDSASLQIEADERDRDRVDDFIARNRDALNASLRAVREDTAKGLVSKRSIDDVIAQGRRRNAKAP
jgi:hypothetical protein